jgi:hypothetical protein
MAVVGLEGAGVPPVFTVASAVPDPRPVPESAPEHAAAEAASSSERILPDDAGRARARRMDRAERDMVGKARGRGRGGEGLTTRMRCEGSSARSLGIDVWNNTW